MIVTVFGDIFSVACKTYCLSG